MTKHEIIIEIGKLEDKLEFADEEEAQAINKRIREWGIKLESLERAERKTRHSYPFNVEEIESLAKDYTSREIAEMFNVDVERIHHFKSYHHIKGKVKRRQKFGVGKEKLEELSKRLSSKEIAEIYNVSAVLVNHYKRKYGIENKVKLTKDKLELLAPRMTNSEIARKFGLSPNSVRKYKSMWKIKGMDAKRGPKFKKEEA